MMATNNILINATASKTGGAETIIRSFAEQLNKYSQHHFILLTPVVFKSLPTNVTLINKSTSGIETLLFATLGIKTYVNKYKPCKILSFTNLNYILNPTIGITYFHQFKLLEKGHKDFKLKIYDIIIKLFLKKNIFVVQTDYVVQAFIQKYLFSKKSIISCWPGFTKPVLHKTASVIENHKLITASNTNFIGLLPIAYDAPHKNVQLVRDLQAFWSDQKVKIVTCLEPSLNDRELIHLGLLSRKQLFKLYQDVDFLIFPSLSETVGLPIFEFLVTGKPAFVYAADYAKKLYKQFNRPDNMILFEDIEEFKSLFLSNINKTTTAADFSDGEWYKIFELL